MEATRIFWPAGSTCSDTIRKSHTGKEKTPGLARGFLLLPHLDSNQGPTD